MDPPRLQLAIPFGNRGNAGRTPFMRKGGNDSVIGVDSNGVHGNEASVGWFGGFRGQSKGFNNAQKRSGTGPV